jgi:TIGR03009 family protein
MSMYPQPMFSKVILSTMAIGLWSQPVSHGLAQEGTTSNQTTARPDVQVAQRLGTPIRQQGEPVQQSGPTANRAAGHSAPFQLSSAEQQFVNQVLMMWENQSNQITTYSCDFQRWEYDPVFGPSGAVPLIKSQGQLTYAKPDKGSFKITNIHRWVQADAQQAGQHVLQKNEIGEHWVCDGKAIFEYKHNKKQLVVQPLPQELRGKSIVDGPLPFLFGAEAEKMKARYWIRSSQGNPNTIMLEAYPRRQVDAANYHHVEVMLDRKSMLPNAIQVHMPNNRNRAVYIFSKPTINGTMNQLFGAIFKSPLTPIGWTRVVQPAPPATPQAALPKPVVR